MKTLIKYLIFIPLIVKLQANVVLYNYTPHLLTATFYYGKTPAKMGFTIKAGESTESAIPSWSTSRRTLKISTEKGKELILQPLEWFTDQIFYIVFENNNLKAYSQAQWNRLSKNVKDSLKPLVKKSLFSSNVTYENKQAELEKAIPTDANEKNWTLISNQYDEKLYAAFYYQGSVTGTLTKADPPIYAIKSKAAGYAQLPPSRFVLDGPRVIVYAQDPSLLLGIIKKEDASNIKGIVPVGLGQGSIALLSPNATDSEIKKTIQSIQIKPLTIVLKSGTTLYYALYQPIYKGILGSVKDFFKNATSKEIEKFQRYKGPEKMKPRDKNRIEGAHTALVAFSANPDSLAPTLTKPILEGSNDIKYIRCQNYEYLIVAKPNDTIFIYTPEQWKEVLSKSAPSKEGYLNKLGIWILNKILGIKK